MTMKYNSLFFMLSILFFCSCTKESRDNLELIVENKTIINKGIGDTCVNILRFSIHNNSDKIYYMNNLCNYKLRPSKKIGIYSDFITLYLYDQNGKEIDYNLSHFKGSDEDLECVSSFFMEKADIHEKSLGYKSRVELFRNFSARNFFIHPKETIYFEHSIDLSGPIGYEDARIGYADLSKNKKYYAKISFASDSTTYKTSLPRDILKTIKANKAEVFSGRIESAKIPIEFVK